MGCQLNLLKCVIFKPFTENSLNRTSFFHIFSTDREWEVKIIATVGAHFLLRSPKINPAAKMHASDHLVL